ncbi:hypothetical protein RhiJN_10107 [Ceratobasidium sp. AG-Ba]|nr:hypothetical protein RhiJN_10107 [Ceratobasidium sp. AG-Ba]
MTLDTPTKHKSTRPLRNVFRLPKSRQRDSFIKAAFAASSLRSSRLVALSVSHNRERPLPMTFHQEWQHKSCSVMKWYDGQKASSTKFYSIQHRKSIQGPFYHEFLLLKLTDGAVCRVERLGEGSPMNAIRLVGIKSHDVIQWYPNEQRSKAEAESESITEVDLGQEFDILDVLVICYAVQKTKPCNVYTLQRYNCYFLCLTILAVLTRRVASWETAITTDIWNDCIIRSLDKVSNLGLEEATQYPILRLCAMLDPDNPQPGALVVDKLRSHLITSSGCLYAHNRAMSGALWRSSLQRALSIELLSEFESVIKAVAEDSSRCGSQIQDIIDTSDDDAATRILGNKKLAGHFTTLAKQVLVPFMNDFSRRYQARQRMEWLETPIPFYLGVLSVILGAVSAPVLKLAHSILSDKDDPGGIVMQYAASVLLVDGKDKTHEIADAITEEIKSSSEFHNTASTTVMDTVASDPGVDQCNLKTLHARSPVGELSLPLLLCPFVVPALLDIGRAVEEERQGIIARVFSEAEAPNIHNPEVTPTEFQTLYIKHRIATHAKRVEDNHITAAPLVREDMEKVMEMVWQNLPSGFGCASIHNGILYTTYTSK